MSSIVAFKADDSEQAELEAYMKAHHFKNFPDFARFAVFGYIQKHPTGAHHPVTGKSPWKASEKTGRCQTRGKWGNPVPR